MPRPRPATLIGLLALAIVVVASFVTARRVEAAAPTYLLPASAHGPAHPAPAPVREL